MTEQLKGLILGSPLERMARALYIRLDPSPGSRYDRLTVAIMQRCLEAASNCIDVGAHRGTILAEMVRLAPHGTHYAFEPVPRHCAYLVKAFPRVQVHQLALSNIRQQADFVHDIRHPTRSSFRLTSEVNEQYEKIKVQTDLLDNIIPPTLPIKFIKIDVEGAELQVLQGAVHTLRTNRPMVVFEHTLSSAGLFDTPSEAVHDLLANDCGLKVSLPAMWLQGKGSLNRDAFRAEVTQGQNIYFVAHP